MSSWYYAAQKALIDIILANSVVTIAHYPADDNQILGYCVTNDDILHWVYIKGAFRRLGIARTLLDAVIPGTRYVTHWTRGADSVADKLQLVKAPERLRGDR